MDWYQNPIKRHGDFADPFVLRYNGRYYLYCTNPDIRCWSSPDLVNWQAEGPTIAPDTFPGLVPFAPEVVYWNGAFYMYTSPSGFGHYVLKSDRPTGPFKRITDNVGHNIDGSVFIDDDGQWYFYWADDSGILACRMKSPTEFSEAVNTGAFMNGWTEGAFVVKHNNKYHMTYTGNHYLSRGYRINAAISDSPIVGFTDGRHNPVIVHTEGSGVGLGHSSTVLGPDLLTHYIFYHNIYPDATRDLNIDRIVLSDAGIHVYGPTRSKQPAPAMPDFFDYFDTDRTLPNWTLVQGEWALKDGSFTTGKGPFECVGKTAMPEAGVIECNIRANGTDDSEYGIFFCGENNCCKLVLNPRFEEIRVLNAQGEIKGASGLPHGFLHEAMHCLRLQYNEQGSCLFVDGRKQMEFGCNLIHEGDRIGYFSDGISISIGYTAFSKGSAEQAQERLYKPVPGVIPLNGCNAIAERINVEKAALYAIAVIGEEPYPEGIEWIAGVDGDVVEAKTVMRKDSCVSTMIISLAEGLHELKASLPDGTAKLSRMEVFELDRTDEVKTGFSKLGPYEKVYAGDDCMGDYFIEAELHAVTQLEEGAAGVLFRLSEPAEGGEGNDRVLGINFFKGYCVSLTGNTIILTKHSYDERELIKKALNETKDTYKLRIKAEADMIEVFVDGSAQPVISYRDQNPYLHGRAGIRAKNCLIDKAVLGITKLE